MRWMLKWMTDLSLITEQGIDSRQEKLKLQQEVPAILGEEVCKYYQYKK